MQKHHVLAAINLKVHMTLCAYDVGVAKDSIRTPKLNETREPEGGIQLDCYLNHAQHCHPFYNPLAVNLHWLEGPLLQVF